MWQPNEFDKDKIQPQFLMLTKEAQQKLAKCELKPEMDETKKDKKPNPKQETIFDRLVKSVQNHQRCCDAMIEHHHKPDRVLYSSLTFTGPFTERAFIIRTRLRNIIDLAPTGKRAKNSIDFNSLFDEVTTDIGEIQRYLNTSIEYLGEHRTKVCQNTVNQLANSCDVIRNRLLAKGKLTAKEKSDMNQMLDSGPVTEESAKKGTVEKSLNESSSKSVTPTMTDESKITGGNILNKVAPKLEDDPNVTAKNENKVLPKNTKNESSEDKEAPKNVGYPATTTGNKKKTKKDDTKVTEGNKKNAMAEKTGEKNVDDMKTAEEKDETEEHEMSSDAVSSKTVSCKEIRELLRELKVGNEITEACGNSKVKAVNKNNETPDVSLEALNNNEATSKIVDDPKVIVGNEKRKTSRKSVTEVPENKVANKIGNDPKIKDENVTRKSHEKSSVPLSDNAESNKGAKPKELSAKKLKKKKNKKIAKEITDKPKISAVKTKNGEPEESSSDDEEKILLNLKNRDNEYICMNMKRKDIEISGMRSCFVELRGHADSLRITNCLCCTFLCGPVSGSFLVENCRRSRFAVACNVLRLYKSINCRIFMYVTGYATMGECRLITVLKYQYYYKGIFDDFQATGMNSTCRISFDIQDFDWIGLDVPSPNLKYALKEPSNWDELRFEFLEKQADI